MDNHSGYELIDRILCFMGECGMRYGPRNLVDALAYVGKMIHEERVITIEDNGLIAVLFFSVCDDYNDYYKKKTWEFRSHNPNGTKVYLELAICHRWTKELRRQLEETLTTKHPQLQTGNWHRWAKWGDRKVTARRSYDKSPCLV